MNTWTVKQTANGFFELYIEGSLVKGYPTYGQLKGFIEQTEWLETPDAIEYEV